MRVSEVYLSVQGEGPHVGYPTVFVRFGGCNLRCPLWPCDTPYAIFPEYRKEWLVQTPAEIFQRIMDVVGHERMFNVCFTGGEPFLQNHNDLAKLYDKLREQTGCNVIEAFSNGALAYPKWVTEKDTVEVVMDWKLPGSGEGETGEGIRKDNILAFAGSDMNRASFNLSVKFTIANREDYEKAKEHYEWIDEQGYFPEVYAGVVWGQLENQTLVEWILHDGLPWRLNVQVHNHVWDRTQRGI